MTETLESGTARGVEPAPPGAVPAQGGWLTTADHKRLGIIWLLASLAFALVSGVVGLVLRADLASSGGIGAVEESWRTLYSLYSSTGTLLFLAPAWIGLATYLVPLQLGSPRIAFPRVQALATWGFVVGGALVVASHLSSNPTSAALSSGFSGGDRSATDLYAASAALVALAVVLASINLVVTVAKMRAPGVTLTRIPLFSWGALVTGVVTIISTPVFLSGLLLLWLDNHFGGVFFASTADNAASTSVWNHSVWLLGRPDVLLVAVPCLAAAGEIVATHTRRPLPGLAAAKAALVLFGGLTLVTWVTASFAAGQGGPIAVPFSSPVSAALLIPVGISLLVWLNALRSPGLKFHSSLLFIAGFLTLVGVGVAAFAVSLFSEVDGGTEWTSGFQQAVLFGAPTLLLAGAVHHWAPKLFGKRLATGGALLEVVLLTTGFVVMGVAGFALGYDGVPAAFLPPEPHTSSGLHGFSAAGGAMVVLGLLAITGQIVAALTARGSEAADSWGSGLTLEWAASSPPPPHNFDELPPIASAAPLDDARNKELV